MRLLVATRSGHKMREIREILGEVPGLELVDLDQAGIGPEPYTRGPTMRPSSIAR